MRNQEFAKLISYNRINNSVNGNPNFYISLDNGDGKIINARSSSDCSWCYGIDSSWIGKTVCYHTTRSGRVDYMKLATIKDTFTDKILML